MLSSITVMDIVHKIIEPLQIKTALEVGTGTGGILGALKVPCKIGVDNYTPDLFTAMENHREQIVVNYDILKLSEIFIPKSFDLVIVFDVLEHFLPEQVPKIIAMCELLATTMVIFWFPMEKELSLTTNPENPGQEHRSLLQVKDFDARGYESIRFPHYWRIPREDPNVDGALCFRKVG